MTNPVFVIQQTGSKLLVSEFLLLEEALQLWNVEGFDHPEYQIVMCIGPARPIPERPIEAIYMFVSYEEWQEWSLDIHGLLDDFSISTFFLGGDHESDS